MSDGMRRELVYLSSYATNRYFIPNWGIYRTEHAKSHISSDLYITGIQPLFPTKITIFYVKFLISEIFLMCAQPSSAFIRVLNMAATVHS